MLVVIGTLSVFVGESPLEPRASLLVASSKPHVPLLGVEAPVGAPLLFLPAVFTIVGVEAPAGASSLFLRVVFTILGVQGVSVFLELLFLTMQTLVGAHCLGP